MVAVLQRSWAAQRSREHLDARPQNLGEIVAIVKGDEGATDIGT